MKIGFVFTIFMTCSLGISSLTVAQQERGMQTVPPRNSFDFTNPGAGKPVETGTRQIPLQNTPFGERPRENFEQMWDKAEEQGRGAKQGAKALWPKFQNPFKRDNADSKPFQFPSNLNRKPNFSNGTVLTDRKQNGFQLPKLFTQKPQWMTDMNQKTKDMFNLNKDKATTQTAGIGNWAQQTSEDWRGKSNQAWKNFSNNMNPKNWNANGGQKEAVTPPLRQADNWQDTLQTKRR